MSKDALGSVYTKILLEEDYRRSVADDPGTLDNLDLTDDEKGVLRQEAGTEVQVFAIGSGPVMSYLTTRRGPPMAPDISSGLGAALNAASGLPVGSLQGPGFVSNSGCCPWGGHSAIPGGAVE